MDYSKIIEASLNEIYIFDAQTLTFIHVNKGAQKQLQYTLDELTQMTPLDIKPEHTLETFSVLVEPLCKGTTEKIVFNTVHQRKDGSTYAVEVHLQLMEIDEQRVFVAIILDQTEKEHLIERNADLARIFRASLNEIYVFDAQTLAFIEVNEGARKNLGYTLDELREMTPLDLKHDYSLETFNDLITPLRTGTKDIIVFETRHYRKDGSTYHVEVHLQQTTYDKRPVFVAIILDITQRRTSENQLLRMKLEMQQTELVQNFVRDTSHEFKTSLAVLGTKSHLLSRYLEDEKLVRHTDAMQAHILRLDKLLTDLNQTALLYDTNVVITTRINLDQLIQQLLEEHEVLFSSKELEIELRFADMIFINGDAELIEAALFNIIKNAYQFTSANGKIVIGITAMHKTVTISIDDTGAGIAPEHLSRLFDPLYRVDEARSMGGGSGFGLTIAKRIIDLHEGTISIDSKLGIGTKVTIRLPQYS